jgi:hypothetical protein
MTYAGLFDLLDARDLLGKLRHDMGRIEKNRLDRFAAFDFFVTADHIVDWLHPNSREKQKAERENSPLLQLCYHMSSGAKHFRATNPTHRSVASTGVHGGFSDAFQADAFAVATLGVVLTDDAANKLGFNWVDALTLAGMVLAFWEAHPAMSGSDEQT